jgi:hypothetical protein
VERLEGALELPGQPVKRGTMAHEHDLYAALADTSALLRDLQRLERYVPRLEELAGRDDHRFYLAIAHRSAGVMRRLGDDALKAAAQFDRALELFESIGAPWQLARTHAEYGELEAEQDNPLAAREYLGRALNLFESLGAQVDSARVRSALHALG